MTTVSDENEKLIINFAWPKVMNVTTKVMSITTGASKKVVKVILTIVNSTSMIYR